MCGAHRRLQPGRGRLSLALLLPRGEPTPQASPVLHLAGDAGRVATATLTEARAGTRGPALGTAAPPNEGTDTVQTLVPC